MKAFSASAFVLAGLFGALASAASAQGPASAASSGGSDVGVPETSGRPAVQEPAATSPSIQSSLGAYGDPGGIRASLEAKGITYQFSYIGEVLGNTSGGVKRGATYEGVIYGQADADLEKLIGIKGLTAHASAFNIHGRGLSGNNLTNFFVVSSIEAYPDTLLYEAWFEKLFANDKIAVRAGNLAVDTEFFISQAATLFVNSTFGWPTNLGTNLPSGANAYPFGTPGVRLKVAPMENLTVLAAIYNGDPAGPYVPGVNNVITQLRDPGGVNFRVQDPPLFITETQYSYNQERTSNALPGTVKLGYLHHFESFPSNSQPDVTLRGNDAVYGLIDQTIYRKAGTEDQGATVFARASAQPSDRNIFDLYFDAGITYKGLIPGRDNDTVGIGGGYGRIASELTNADNISGAAPLVRDYEALIEATYQFTVLPGFTVQPDFQYIFHPGASSIGDPGDGLPLRDAAVFGLRTTIVY